MTLPIKLGKNIQSTKGEVKRLGNKINKGRNHNYGNNLANASPSPKISTEQSKNETTNEDLEGESSRQEIFNVEAPGAGEID